MNDTTRHILIDKILEFLKDGRPYSFRSVVKKIDPGFVPDSESLWNYMLNENLIDANDDSGEAFFGINDTKISHYGITVLEHGGWIKHRKKKRIPVSERPWIVWSGWIYGTIATVVLIVQFFWPPQDKIQRQEFITNNPPQLELWYSAFHPGNRDPSLKETSLDDSIGITGSYRLTNKGRAIITLEKIDLPRIFNTRGYYTDQVIK